MYTVKKRATRPQPKTVVDRMYSGRVSPPALRVLNSFKKKVLSKIHIVGFYKFILFNAVDSGV